MAERENLPVPVNPDFNLEIGGLQPDDPVHFGQMNTILARLLTNEAFLEKLAGKMVEKASISHVLDSANPSMVLGADQAPELTKLIDVERKRIGELYSDLVGKANSSDLDTLIKTELKTITMPATQPGRANTNSIPYTPPAGYIIAALSVYTFSGCISDGYYSKSGYLSGTLYNLTNAVVSVEIGLLILLLRTV